MARTTKKKETAQETVVVTRAEKKDATKNLIRELLAVKPHKHNELLDGVATLYTERYGGEDTENVNDVKGRIGSVLDIMKKESEVAYDGGMYALKARALPKPSIEEMKTVKKVGRKKKEETATESTAKKEEKKKTPKTEEKPKKTVKKQAVKKEETLVVEPTAETPAVKKRGRKPKAKAEPVVAEETNDLEKTEEKPAKTVEKSAEMEVSKEVKTQENALSKEPMAQKKTPEKESVEKVAKPAVEALTVKEKAEVAKKDVVMDMSFLFGSKAGKNSAQKPQKEEVKAETTVTPIQKTEQKTERKTTQKTQKTEKTVNASGEGKAKTKTVVRGNVRGLRLAAERPLTADERLRESFLKKLRSLGGDYFEYYSVYLLERYSIKNGRRLEGLRVNGGDRDGGIDGEIEVTDKLGFRETIYIQSKNWNPEKGDEKLWVVGETLLQQFIGACVCRQAKDGKQHCRGIFITTSRFTPEAKRILDDMSDKIVGYDGNDVYETAKECSFGLVRKNGEWALDEKVLSGPKAFFNLY